MIFHWTMIMGETVILDFATWLQCTVSHSFCWKKSCWHREYPTIYKVLSASINSTACLKMVVQAFGYDFEKKTDLLGVKEVKFSVDSTKNQRSREFFLPTFSMEKKASFRWTYLGWNPGENCMFTALRFGLCFCWLLFIESWRCLWIHWTDVFSRGFVCWSTEKSPLEILS